MIRLAATCLVVGSALAAAWVVDGSANGRSISPSSPAPAVDAPVRTNERPPVSDREGELRRKPRRSVLDGSLRSRSRVDGELRRSAERREAIQRTAEMPRSACTAVQPVGEPSPGDFNWAGHAHQSTLGLFWNTAGFGLYRMALIRNSRGVTTGAEEIDRVELVSLLQDAEPAAYVLDEMATPELARIARRRELDAFEKLGLKAVREGADLVWSPEAPRRMFGAIRAEEHCLECHPGARKKDLLGAFTYFLTTSVGEIGRRASGVATDARGRR